nr:hypothetical protein TQ38_27555 [Novosphingobium sp. P6W]
MPQVTLCAASSVNVAATIKALERCMDKARFGAALLFTDDCTAALPPTVRRVEIAPLHSSAQYSRFMLGELAPWITTSHCLVVQWDGFIVNPHLWDTRFLDYDYIGASWPQFADGHDVGNGGFSLRSRRLLDACLAQGFRYDGEAEDLAICRTNRKMLEIDHAIRFADRETADSFSAERRGAVSCAFGFHGAFNLIEAVGVSAFQETYRKLDHRATLRIDLWPIFLKLLKRGAIASALRFASSIKRSHC